MNTTKTLFTAILVLLTLTISGQADKDLFATAEYPFISYEHDDLTLESWMSTPFIANDPEEELILEDWMSNPFNTEEELQVENWMTVALWK